MVKSHYAKCAWLTALPLLSWASLQLWYLPPLSRIPPGETRFHEQLFHCMIIWIILFICFVASLVLYFKRKKLVYVIPVIVSSSVFYIARVFF